MVIRWMLSDAERRALLTLTPDWSPAPAHMIGNAMLARLEAFGLIECKWWTGGMILRVTRDGFVASGRYLQ
jgi:hypothetical protein